MSHCKEILTGSTESGCLFLFFFFSREAELWTQTPSLGNAELVLLGWNFLSCLVTVRNDLQCSVSLTAARFSGTCVYKTFLSLYPPTRSKTRGQTQLVACALAQDLMAYPSHGQGFASLTPQIPDLPTCLPSTLASSSLLSSPGVNFLSKGSYVP